MQAPCYMPPSWHPLEPSSAALGRLELEQLEHRIARLRSSSPPRRD